jgi:peptide/nickel transport system substrate-binding protein
MARNPEAHRSRSRSGIAAVLMLTAAALVSAAVAAGATHKTVAKPTLTVGLPGAPTSLDPAHDVYGYFSIGMRPFANESILHLKPDGTVGPGLATSWRYFSTGRGANKDFEFTLRHNARFSDGSPVTAAAAVASMSYFLAANGSLSTLLGPKPQFVAKNKWTVQIHTLSPISNIPQVLAEWNQWGALTGPTGLANPSSLGTSTDGAGPYRIDAGQSVTNDHYTFVPNPYYYDKSKQRWSSVVVKIIGTPSTMVQAAQSGQVDIGVGDPTTADAGKAAGLSVATVPASNGALVLMDRLGTIAKPLADLRVRQALNYAVDRKALTSAIVGKYGSPTSEPVTTDGWDPKYENYYPYKPAKAKQLLAQAGYANGFSFDAVGAAFGTGGIPLLTAMSKYFDAVGVHVNITAPASQPAFIQALFAKKFPAFSLSFQAFTGNLFWATFLKPGVLTNPYGAEDPTMDKDWVQAAKVTDAGAIWRHMMAQVVKQAWFVPVYKQDVVYFYNRKKVTAPKIGVANPYILAADLAPAK